MLLPLSVSLLAIVGVSGQQTGNHPEWNRWCGKAYEAGHPAFDPGGQTLPPAPIPGPPLLDVQFKPRYSLYLDSEETGEFIVNAPLSQFFGKAWPNATSARADQFVFSINLVSNDDPLVENRVTINSTGNVFGFDLKPLKASLEPIRVVLYGGPEGGDPMWTATSELYYLPEKSNGSVTKVDNLNGGMLFRNKASNNTFEPLLAYGFYSSYDGFLRNVSRNDTSVLQHYVDLGLNAITPLTNYRDSVVVFDVMNEMNLKYMFDMREYYKNLTMVREQVLQARDADAIFAYWTADEPDGWQDPFEAPTLAYDLVRRFDPYHPVAVVLNCQNYYFKKYTAGADIIMEDVYPIGINSTFSKWGTACNTTLGDCGCDNCEGNVQDVSSRLDDLATYERWENLWPKTKIHNPQSFHGEDYWFRDPSPDEEYVMALLAFNHGAQSIISWVYPTSDLLGATHGKLSKVVTASPVVDFLVGGDRPHRVANSVCGIDVVDAAYWVVGKQMLVSIVNGGYVDINQTVTVTVPGAVKIAASPWGNLDWKVVDSELSVPLLPALSTSLLVLNLGAGE